MLARALFMAGLRGPYLGSRALLAAFSPSNATATVGRRTLSSLVAEKNTSTTIDDIPTDLDVIKKYESMDPEEILKEVEDPAIRSELAKLKVLENETIANLSYEAPPIDWDEWRNKIRFPGIVDALKTMQDSVQIPDYENERKEMVKIIRDTFEPLLVELKELAIESETETSKLEKRLEELTHLRDNLEEMSVDEFLDKYPDIKAQIDDDIANNRWYIEQ